MQESTDVSAGSNAEECGVANGLYDDDEVNSYKYKSSTKKIIDKVLAAQKDESDD